MSAETSQRNPHISVAASMTSARLALLAVIYSWRILMCRTDAAAVAHRHKHAHHKNAGLQLLQHATHFRPMNSRLKIAVLLHSKSRSKAVDFGEGSHQSNLSFQEVELPHTPSL